MSASPPTTDKQPLQKRDDTVSSGLGASTPTPSSATPRIPISLNSEPLPRPAHCTEYGFYRFLTVAYSAFNFILGMAALIIGVWALSAQFEPLNGTIMGPTVMTITAALLLVITSPMGVVAGRRGNLMLLRCFIIVVIMIFVFQVFLGITAFSYRLQASLKAEAQLKRGIKRYFMDEKIKAAMDKMQETMKCCGGRHDPADWNLNSNFSCNNSWSQYTCGVPDSCCRDKKLNCGRNKRANMTMERSAAKNLTVNQLMFIRGLHEEPCADRFLKLNEFLLDILGATSLSYAILHIIGIFFIYMLIVQLEDKQQLFQYRTRYYNNS